MVEDGLPNKDSKGGIIKTHADATNFPKRLSVSTASGTNFHAAVKLLNREARRAKKKYKQPKGFR